MIAIAVLAFVVQGGASSLAPPVSVFSRSETSTTGGRRLRVLVRIDAHAAIKDVRIAEVIENVRAIWRPYAEIDFAGIEGGAGGLYDDELRLVISGSGQPPGSATAAVLGWIEFLDGRPRNTINISVAAARTLMNRGKWLGRPIDTMPMSLQQRFLTRALSRSAAHEMGHYLLRSTAHAVRGLMREKMTVEEIMDDLPALYQLLPSEIVWLDQRLAGTLAEAPASDPRNLIRTTS